MSFIILILFRRTVKALPPIFVWYSETKKKERETSLCGKKAEARNMWEDELQKEKDAQDVADTAAEYE